MKSRQKRNQLLLNRRAVGQSRHLYSEMKNTFGKLAPETIQAAEILTIDIEEARRSEVFKMKMARS